MEIKIKDEKIKVTKPSIIGLMGNNYEIYLEELSHNKRSVGYIKKNEYYYTNYVYDELLLFMNRCKCEVKNVAKRMEKVLDSLSLPYSFLEREISDLSKGEKRILSYLRIFIYNPKVLIIDEPFKNLDYKYEKIVINYLRELKNKYNKTIIIASNNSNIIYENTNKTIIIDKDIIFKDTIKLFSDNEIIEKYNLNIPNLVMFSKLAEKKNKKIKYYQDNRELMKEVYRNV